MNTLLLLASEGGSKTLWDPTILGLLVVVSAVGLFCGSVYLLLGTNLGARLGFLVAAACLTGFWTLLTLIWLTTATPLNSPHGRQPEWKVKEVIAVPNESKIGPVKTIFEKGEKATDDEIATIRPAIDAALVKIESLPGHPAPEQPLAKFSTSADYAVGTSVGLGGFVTGGGDKNVFWHVPEYAVIQFCPATAELTCQPGSPVQLAVLEHDLGSMKLPPLMYFLASLVLFVLSLLGLHWRERDERAKARAAATPTPVPAS